MTKLVHHPTQAAVSMIGAMMMIGFIDNFIAVIGTDVGLWQFQLMRSAMALPILGLVFLLGFGRYQVKRLWAVLLRNLLISIAMLFYFGALAFMSIAEALAGLFTSPIFILILTALVFRERVGIWRIIAVLLGFAGILVVLSPDTGAVGFVNFLPVVGGLFYAMGSLATRRICADESTLSMLTWLMIIQASIGAAALIVLAIWAPEVPAGADGFLLRGIIWPELQTYGWILLQAAGSLIGVGLIIRAYQLGDASYVAVFEYTVFIAGPFFAWMLFGQTLGTTQMIGIALVALAGCIIALRSAKT